MVRSRRWRANVTSQRTARVRDAPRRNLDRHLVGGATNAAGADLQNGGQSLDARLSTSSAGLPVRSSRIASAS